MSKTLFIMRHAKTEPFSDSGQDFGRQLTAKGFDVAGRMGERLARAGHIPQVVFCSTALRTEQTLEAAWPHWQQTPPEVTHTDTLYLASQGDLLTQVNSLPDTVESAMLIGHNPGLHQLVQSLSGGVLAAFSPGTVAVLHSDHADWKSIRPGDMVLNEILLPE